MKKELKDANGKRIHSYVPELCEQLRKGEVDRREFLRTATLLGVSAGAAYTMAGKILGEAITPRAMADEMPKRGGRWWRPTFFYPQSFCSLPPPRQVLRRKIFWPPEKLFC